MAVDISVHIKSIYPSLTKTEKRVADYILDRMYTLSYVSVTELAKKCDVGEATIFRFAKKIGFSGFQEFKKELVKSSTRKEVDTKNVDNKIEETYSDMMVMLNHTVHLSDVNKLNEAAELITKSDNIIFFGIGSSNLTALAATTKLCSLGYNAFSSYDETMQFYRANTLTSKDLVIALSVSGDTIKTVKNTRIAKANGAKIIAITNNVLSPISKLSDITLLTACKEVMAEGISFTTQISQLFILEQLCKRLIELDKKSIEFFNNKIIYKW